MKGKKKSDKSLTPEKIALITAIINLIAVILEIIKELLS